MAKKIIVLLVALVLICSGCNKPVTNDQKVSDTDKNIADSPADNDILGTLNENEYTNNFFGFSMDINDEWVKLDRKQIDAIATTVFKNMTADMDDESKKIYEETQDYIKHLIIALKYPLDYTEGFNPNFQCVAENLEMFKDENITSAKEYLQNSKNTYSQNAPEVLFSDITEEEIGGKTFYKLSTQSYGEAGNMSQEQYSILIDENYILSFSISYEEADEYYEMLEILNSIKFN